MNEQKTDALSALLVEHQRHFNQFTYGHYRDPVNHNVLQVGISACFYLDQGYTEAKCEAIAQVLTLYHRLWGDQLQWGYQDGEPNQLHPYHDSSIDQKRHYIESVGPHDLDLYWSSSPSLDYVPNYLFAVFSPAG